MYHLSLLEPVDYLVIGHITRDLTPQGYRIGGTASYSALTAKVLGLRVGIVTSWAGEIPQEVFRDISVINSPAEICTTFENRYTSNGRVQVLHQVAPTLDYSLVPEVWRQVSIVHLGPVAQEVDPLLVRRFSSSMVGITPQGWLRCWDKKGHVSVCEWPEAAFILQQVGAAVISVEDVGGDEDQIEEMALHCRILAVTEAHCGARVYWNGDLRRIRPPAVDEIDATGAGDIFATAFFIRLLTTRDPWESARFANHLASHSVTRIGLDSIPTPAEVQEGITEVL